MELGNLYLVIMILLGIFSAFMTVMNYRLAQQKASLRESLKQVAPTALAMFQGARKHDDDAWRLRLALQTLMTKHADINELPNILADAGKVHAQTEVIVRDLIGIYYLSGGEISDERVQAWVEDGFIPEHYKPYFLSYIR